MELRLDWDDTKSELLKAERGYSFEEVSKVFLGSYFEMQKNDDPEQFLAIGFVGTKLISVVFEFREDEIGEYGWLVTYWKSTKNEEKIYEENT